MSKRKRTPEEYVYELSCVNPNVVALEKYINNKTPIEHRCLKDGHVWSPRPQRMLLGDRCPQCTYNEAKNRYVQQLSIKHPNIILIEEYNASKEIKHRCLLDGYEWHARPACILRAKGCPVCMGKRIGPDPEYKNSIYKAKRELQRGEVINSPRSLFNWTQFLSCHCEPVRRLVWQSPVFQLSQQEIPTSGFALLGMTYTICCPHFGD